MMLLAYFFEKLLLFKLLLFCGAMSSQRDMCEVYCRPSLLLKFYCFAIRAFVTRIASSKFLFLEKNVAANNEQTHFDSLLFVIFIINGRAGVAQSSVHESDFSDCVPLIFGGISV